MTVSQIEKKKGLGPCLRKGGEVADDQWDAKRETR